MSTSGNEARSDHSKGRRRLLLLGGTGLLAGTAGYFGLRGKNGAPAEPAAPVSAASRMTAPSKAEPFRGPGTPGQFEPHLSTEFTVVPAGGARVTLKLSEVGRETVQDSFKGRWASFNLLFEGPRLALPPDGSLCHVQHPVLGEMEFFLSPVGAPGDRSFYEAVFSRQA